MLQKGHNTSYLCRRQAIQICSLRGMSARAFLCGAVSIPGDGLTGTGTGTGSISHNLLDCTATVQVKFEGTHPLQMLFLFFGGGGGGGGGRFTLQNYVYTIYMCKI